MSHKFKKGLRLLVNQVKSLSQKLESKVSCIIKTLTARNANRMNLDIRFGQISSNFFLISFNELIQKPMTHTPVGTPEMVLDMEDFTSDEARNCYRCFICVISLRHILS